MTDLWYGTSGPRNARIMIVGESWGSEELQQQVPFVGQSGKELDRMLAEAGLDRSTLFLTNVVAAQPKGNDLAADPRYFLPNTDKPPQWRGLCPTPFTISEVERLWTQIEKVDPVIVIAMGNYALWATTNCCSTSSTSLGDGVTVRVPGGITSWRGSMLTSEASVAPPLAGRNVLPIIHPAAILRAWYQRAVTVHDLRTRVPMGLMGNWRPRPEPTILAPPTFEQATARLNYWLMRLESGQSVRLAHDIETARTLITCMGFADGGYDSKGFAMVIPFVRLLKNRQFESYWPPEQEATLVKLMQAVLTHPNVLIEGQNYVYDMQYIYDFWRIHPKFDFDTMLAHHLLFPGTPKGLDYLSSLYCRYHWYWKDDNKEWDMKESEKEHLEYNAVDVLRTYECATVLRGLIKQFGQEEQWGWEKRKIGLAYRMMLRGVLIDTQRRARLGFELLQSLQNVQSRLAAIVPEELCEGAVKSKTAKPWYSSPKKQQFLFYEVLGLSRQRNRKSGNPSVDDEALRVLKRKHPEFSPIFDLLAEERSIGVFHDTFVMAKLDPDHRMRCSYGTTDTFRWSSSKNAFGRGTNLQNIPSGEEE